MAADIESKNFVPVSVWSQELHIEYKFTMSVTMDISPFAWLKARDVLNILHLQ